MSHQAAPRCGFGSSEERSATGTPSRLDFLVYELPVIIEVFGTKFDELPPLVGAPDNYKSLIGQGIFVQYYFIAGHLNDNNIIELLSIDIELHQPEQ